MATSFLSVWCGLGDALYCTRKFVELAWVFYGKETEKKRKRKRKRKRKKGSKSHPFRCYGRIKTRGLLKT